MGVLGVGASGSFPVVVGDIVEITNTAAASGAGCDQSAVYVDRNSFNIITDTQTGYGSTATATWTVTNGTTYVTLSAGLNVV